MAGKKASKAVSAREQLSEYQRKRDFSRTAEPAGGGTRKSKTVRLEFVIQKHAATRLHFDLRLELDGVMKSWAVPRGPSPDPMDKRLAVQVEDHPMEYNNFEGTIPKGEYGGGTVMIWDHGWYEHEVKGGGAQAIRAGYHKGDLKVVFHGKRMKGSWVLVRTRGYGDDGKPSWLLIKHRDQFAESGGDLVETHLTSVATKRTMEQIGGATRARVWHSHPRDAARAEKDWTGVSLPRRARSIAEVRRERAAAEAAAAAGKADAK
ncbi:MAG: DNA polymerase ligase N-terminal domain-containing protein [Gemmatimonadota bacterium]